MYNLHGWLEGHPAARFAVRQAVIERALTTAGQASLLWDACTEPLPFADSFTVRRMTDEEANFRHKAVTDHDDEMDEILAEMADAMSEHFTEGFGPKAEFKGLVLESSSSTLWIWWGYETSTPVIHIRCWNDLTKEDKYRDHPLMYRDGRDRGYVLTMTRGMIVGVNNAKARLPTDSTWAIEHLPDIRGEVWFEIEHAINEMGLGPVPDEATLFPKAI